MALLGQLEDLLLGAGGAVDDGEPAVLGVLSVVVGDDQRVLLGPVRQALRDPAGVVAGDLRVAPVEDLVVGLVALGVSGSGRDGQREDEGTGRECGEELVR